MHIYQYVAHLVDMHVLYENVNTYWLQMHLHIKYMLTTQYVSYPTLIYYTILYLTMANYMINNQIVKTEKNGQT